MPVYKCPESEDKIYKCLYCNKPFKSRQSKYQHHKCCKKNNEKKESISEIDKLKLKIQEQEEILKQKHEEIENLKSSKMINIEQMNVYINAFGEEKTDYITNHKMKKK